VEAEVTFRRLSPALARQLLVGLFLLLCYGFFHQGPIWNEPSRYDLVVAIVDDHTTQIDRNQANTGDKAFYNGHYYSDKEPGTAILGVPVYGVMRLVRLATHQPAPNEIDTIQVLAFVICAIPTALLAMLLIRFLKQLVSEWWAIAVTLAFALGTMAFPFATMFFGHAAAAFFLFAIFYLLRQVPRPGRPWLPALAGFCAGWAVIVDFSAAVGVVILAIYALRPLFVRPVLGSFRRPAVDNFKRPLLPAFRTPLLFIAGAAPLAVLLFAYNWVSFGGPLSLGYAHLANSFASAQSQGILGVTLPKLGAIGDLLFGGRGLLVLSPWLVLAPAGLWAARRPGLRWEIGVCAAFVIAYLLVNGGYFLPFGGATPGPRFLVPMLPFAAVLVALAPRVVRYLAALLMVPSIALTAIATATVPSANEGLAHPLTDLWLPLIRGRLLVETTGWLRWGLHGDLPLAVLALAAACAGLAVRATSTAAAWIRRLGAGAAVVLGVLVVSLGTPLDAPSEFGLAAAVHLIGVGQGGAGVTIVDTGVSGILTAPDGHTSVKPWAQLEARDLGAPETRVVFTIYDASGRSVFAVFYDHVAWSSHQRRTLAVEWGTGGVPPGRYSLNVGVASEDGHTQYAAVADGNEFTVPAKA
jgi:hypothetical protein